MKTFSRKRKSSSPQEFVPTNGTTARPHHSIERNAARQFSNSPEHTDRGHGLTSPGLPNCRVSVPGTASLISHTTGKRKLEDAADASPISRKDARVTSPLGGKLFERGRCAPAKQAPRAAEAVNPITSYFTAPDAPVSARKGPQNPSPARYQTRAAAGSRQPAAASAVAAETALVLGTHSPSQPSNQDAALSAKYLLTSSQARCLVTTATAAASGSHRAGAGRDADTGIEGGLSKRPAALNSPVHNVRRGAVVADGAAEAPGAAAGDGGDGAREGATGWQPLRRSPRRFVAKQIASGAPKRAGPLMIAALEPRPAAIAAAAGLRSDQGPPGRLYGSGRAGHDGETAQPPPSPPKPLSPSAAPNEGTGSGASPPRLIGSPRSLFWRQANAAVYGAVQAQAGGAITTVGTTAADPGGAHLRSGTTCLGTGTGSGPGAEVHERGGVHAASLAPPSLGTHPEAFMADDSGEDPPSSPPLPLRAHALLQPVSAHQLQEQQPPQQRRRVPTGGGEKGADTRSGSGQAEGQARVSEEGTHASPPQRLQAQGSAQPEAKLGRLQQGLASGAGGDGRGAALAQQQQTGGGGGLAVVASRARLESRPQPQTGSSSAGEGNVTGAAAPGDAGVQLGRRSASAPAPSFQPPHSANNPTPPSAAAAASGPASQPAPGTSAPNGRIPPTATVVGVAPAVAAAPVASSRATRPIGRGRLPGAPGTAPAPAKPPTAPAAPAAALVAQPPGQASCPKRDATLGPAGRQQAAAVAAPAVSAGTHFAAGRRGGAPAGGSGVGADGPLPSTGRPRGGSQGESEWTLAAAAAATSEAAAQSIVEAQERGELLQLQDDALYALDGLKQAERAVASFAAATGAGCTAGGGGGPGPRTGPGTASAAAGAVRESATTLAGILATRRGRAALSRPTNLAQQALTSMARVAIVPRDPVAALAASVILLALVQEDALPAYGASYAAAVLMRQVLQQVEQDPPPLLAAAAVAHVEPSTAQVAVAGGSAANGVASSWALLAAARAAATGGGAECSGGAAVRRLLRLIQEGPLSRQVGRPNLVMSPLPMVLLAMVAASEAAPSRIQFVERFKDNLPKAGLLQLLGRLVAARRDVIVRHLYDVRAATAAAAAGADLTTPPAGARERQRRVQGGGGGAATASVGAETAIEDFQFPDLIASPGDDDTAQPQAGRAAGDDDDPYTYDNTPADATDAAEAPLGGSVAAAPPLPPLSARLPKPPSPLPAWVFWELQLLLRVLENATFTHTRNENELLALRVASVLPVPYTAAAAAAVEAMKVGAAASAAAAPTAPDERQPQLAGSQPQPGSQRPESQSYPLSQAQPPLFAVEGSQPESQQTLELMAMSQPGSGPAAGAPFVAVLVDIVRQLSELADIEAGSDPGGGPGDQSGAAGGAGPRIRRTLSAGATTTAAANAAAPSAAAVSQVCTAVLMNVTHEHSDGVAAVAAAGGLQAIGGLVWRCCKPRVLPLASTVNVPTRAAGGAAVQRLEVSKQEIVENIEVLSVCLGLLINMTSKSSHNQRALRQTVLLLNRPSHAASLPAVNVHGQQQQQPGSGPGPSDAQAQAAAGSLGAGDALLGDGAEGHDGGRRIVPLLVAILNAMSPQPPSLAAVAAGARETGAAKPGGQGKATSYVNDTYDIGDGDDDSDMDDVEAGALRRRGTAGGSGAGSGAGAAGGSRPASTAAAEVTEAALSADHEGGQASIAQVYAAILLGYLIAGSDEDREDEDEREQQGCRLGRHASHQPQRAVEHDLQAGAGAAASGDGSAAAARAEARGLLVGGSLRPVTAGISRCLEFYLRAGAITDTSKEALTGLLRRLMRLEVLERGTAAVEELSNSYRGHSRGAP